MCVDTVYTRNWGSDDIRNVAARVRTIANIIQKKDSKTTNDQQNQPLCVPAKLAVYCVKSAPTESERRSLFTSSPTP